VTWATADGTALAGSDYLGASGQLSYPTGSANGATRTLGVTLLDDPTDEANETLSVVLSGPSGAALGSPQVHVRTINDDDPPALLSIGDASLAEGATGTRSLVFTATLSPFSGQDVSVAYATADGTAIAGSDYVAVSSGTLTIPAGSSSGTLAIGVRGDTLAEGDEVFFVNLSNPVNATLLDAGGDGTILNDDVAGTLQFSLASYTLSEAAKQATIGVKRTGGGAAGVSVSWEATSGTATAGADYAAAAGTLSFGGNVNSSSFTVPLLSDTLDEPNETLLLRLFAPSVGASLGPPATAVLTIGDNDAGGRLQWGAASYTVQEGAGQAVLTLRRIGGAASGVSVAYSMAPGSATAGADYSPASGALTFSAGQATQTLAIPIGPDAAAEGKESFTVTLANPLGGATLGTITTATVTIADDDGTAVFFDRLTYSAGEAARNAVISVRRSGDLSAPSSVEYLASNGTAQQPGDYLPAAGTLSFLPNQALRTFMVPIANDAEIDEGAETVALGLQNPSLGTALGTQAAAILTITDNDPVQVIQFVRASYSVPESAPKVILAVSRTGGTAGTATIDYAVTAGTATQPEDFTLPAGSLTFGPGQASQTIQALIADDADTEGTQSFTVTLSLAGAPAGVTLGALDATTVEIRDSEPSIGFSTTRYSISEAAARSLITLRRTGPTTAPATVQYVITGGTAGAGADYTAATSGVLSFLAGRPTTTLEIPIVRDAEDEAAETVLLQLQNPSPGPPGGWGLGIAFTTLTINDNDTAGKAQFSLAAYSGSEGEAATISVVRRGGASGSATVVYATSNGTATAPDYASASGTLSFGPGETTRTFAVSLSADASTEGNESVLLSLSSPGGGLLLGSPASATLWIVDDD
jgi:hypothetical protein